MNPHLLLTNPKSSFVGVIRIPSFSLDSSRHPYRSPDWKYTGQPIIHYLRNGPEGGGVGPPNALAKLLKTVREVSNRNIKKT